jgi:hypothetical protein
MGNPRQQIRYELLLIVSILRQGMDANIGVEDDELIDFALLRSIVRRNI